MDNLFLFLLLYVFLFFISVFITRWIFGIDKIVKNLAQQTDLLEVQAKATLDQRALIKLLLIDQMGGGKKIIVTSRKDGTVSYPTLREWIDKYSSDAYITEVIVKEE